MAWERGPGRPALVDKQVGIYPLVLVAGLAVVFMVARQYANTPAKQHGNAPAKQNANTPDTRGDIDTASEGATFQAASHYKDGKYHLLLAATGSVAAIKIPNICNALSKHANLSIRVLLSAAATSFLAGQSPEQPAWRSLAEIKNVDGVYVDRHEWDKPWTRGDPILHIELRRWADLMVIAPLSADGLAKLALGVSDNLVTSVARAWDTTGQIDGLRPGVARPAGGAGKTVMVAPAMNTAMWRHPATRRHLDVLAGEWGVENGGWIELLAPIEKGLACGDVGSGGMRDWTGIVSDIERKFPDLRSEADG